MLEISIEFWSSGILTGSQTGGGDEEGDSAVLEQWHSDW